MPFTPARTRILLGAVLLPARGGCWWRCSTRWTCAQLDAVDHDLGAGPQEWTYRHVGAQHFLLFVEAAFATIPHDDRHGGGRGPRWSCAGTRGPRSGPSA